ncbi:MAG: dTMP kinase [Bacteroidota bacterium]|nr:dTMP kinase [Candidatus Kapabacteria bacterium]MCS7301857.1 dTMP kinase [Candidatus Kapabacteria bacterium]MCX7936110.1 dTMP kinase [Chlorobiota bacterium]MDW8074996.1 dTMP kinase [Bacteroidota bacterium]MDW8271635.1 dTMP kinase [Bacteroidota bacterium]
MFITFEGIDGSGKSTHVALVAEWLQQQGLSVRVFREPGATPLSEAIRSILLDGRHRISPVAELFLFCAARRQLVEEALRPALARGEVVICDRYADSTIAYQGYGRMLDLAMVERVIGYAIEEVVPDVTFILDLDVNTALSRRGDRASVSADRMEDAPVAFFERVRAGYRAIAERHPERVVLLDATQPVEVLQHHIRGILTARLRVSSSAVVR